MRRFIRIAAAGIAAACLTCAPLPRDAGSFRAWGPPVAEAAGPPEVTAEAAVLLDAESGRVLYQKHANERLEPASITKIVTALVALRHGNPEQVLTVDRASAAAPGSSAGLVPGERLTLRELLYALLLVSGNDAAETIARGLGGSIDTFAAWMNQAARDAGAAHSHFTNPHGLPDPAHETTALDMALITRAALQSPLIAKIVATREASIGGRGGPVHRYVNENKLLGRDGVDGVKTGYTTSAGHTYVASATRDGRRLIVVVLGDSKQGKYDDAMRLFDWGFAQFQPRRLLAPGQEVGQVQVVGGTRYYTPLVVPAAAGVTVRAAPWDTVAIRTEAVTVMRAPVPRGLRVGTLTVYVGGRRVASYPMLVGVQVPRAAATPVAGAGPAWWHWAWDWVRRLASADL